MRHALYRGRAGPYDRDALVRELVQFTSGVAAGVIVVPAAGVEGVPLVAVDSRDAGQLGPVQRSIRHDHVTRAKPVAAIGGNDPSVLVLVPPEFLNLGLEEGAAVKVELVCDSPRVLQNFRREGILLLRHIAGLLEQRQIDVSLDIALRPGITVPVPGAAEVTAFLDDTNVL